jgi:hypothetical protein
MFLQRHALQLGLVAGVALQGGCLYHAGKDTLARGALADFKDAQIGASLDDELAHSKEMLQAELASTQHELEARRDEAVAHVLDLRWSGGPTGSNEPCSAPNAGTLGSDTFECELNTLLADVAGKPEGPELPVVAFRAQLAAAAAMQGIAQNELATTEQSFRLILPPADAGRIRCPASGDPDRAVVEVHAEMHLLPVLFDRYTESCRALQKATAAAASFPENGKLGATRRTYVERKSALDDMRGRAAEQTRTYEIARAAYDRAVEDRTALRTELTSGDQKLKEADAKVTKAADAARKALDRLGQLSGDRAGVQDLLSTVEYLRARYGGVVDAIGRLADGKPKADSGLEVVLGAGLRLDEIQRGTGLPRLLLEAERLRGQLTVTQILADHYERQVALLQTEQRGRFEQFSHLMQASTQFQNARSCAIDGPKPNSVPADVSVYQRFRRGGAACKEAIAGALVAYANAYTIGELHSRIAQTQRLGDVHEQAIETSIAALHVWETALGVPMNAVADRYASGIKPEELAKLAVGAVGAGALVGIAGK